ncbi:RNA polymerase sigma factor [Pedobacter sp. GR22-6]|uniref:RNA polymerase sigma factor n=1 Tax=Pedobacter sp. GR22-6 TaxID=3127957 RepID=UPI00307E170A
MNSYKTFSDTELCSLLKDGDESAYTEIYNRYWQTIYSIAYNRLRNLESAQDLVHDTFASLWINREKVSIENLKSYLAVSIKYRIIELIRREKLASTFELLAPSAYPGNFNDASEALHFKNILRLMEEEIENLPERCKLIFKYSRNENKSAKEIASELNISQSTVENQLNKALSRLRLVLKNLNSFFF